MKKLCFFVVCLLLLSGCSAIGENEVLKDGTVNENVSISENSQNLYVEDESMESYVQSLIDVYIDTIRPNNYEYSKEVNDNNATVKFNKKYNNICSYFKNSLFVSIFMDEHSCNETEEYYEVNAKSSYFVCGDDCLEKPELDNVRLSFKFNQKVLSSNADMIEGDTYAWNFNASKENTLTLRIEKPKKSFVEEIKENQNSNIGILVAVVLVVVIILFILILLNKNRKNKIDYS